MVWIKIAIGGIKFKYGLITNITHEHLDYHRTFANYRQAKLKLLAMSENKVSFTPSDNFSKPTIMPLSAIAAKMGIKPTVIDKALKTFPRCSRSDGICSPQAF